MTHTREEIEAALAGSIHRVQLHNDWVARNQPNCSPYWDDDAERLDSRKRLQDCARIADTYLSDCQQRERDQQPPTREMFERLGAVRQPWGLARGLIEWGDACKHPIVYFTSPTRDVDVDLDTIAKLRAACLLLGINTEGVI